MKVLGITSTKESVQYLEFIFMKTCELVEQIMLSKRQQMHLLFAKIFTV